MLTKNVNSGDRYIVTDHVRWIIKCCHLSIRFNHGLQLEFALLQETYLKRIQRVVVVIDPHNQSVTVLEREKRNRVRYISMLECAKRCHLIYPPQSRMFESQPVILCSLKFNQQPDIPALIVLAHIRTAQPICPIKDASNSEKSRISAGLSEF